MLYEIVNKGCTIPVNGLSGHRHVICRLAQVEEKLQLISQYQIVPLQLLTELLEIISCKTRPKKYELLLHVSQTHDIKLQLGASDKVSHFTFGSSHKVSHSQLPLLEVL